MHWVHAHVRTFYDSDGNRTRLHLGFSIIDDEVRVMKRSQPPGRGRHPLPQADGQFGPSGCVWSAPTAATRPSTRLCGFSGTTNADPDALADLTTAATLERDLRGAGMLAGRVGCYRVVKQYVRRWPVGLEGTCPVSCLRDEDGQVEYFISQVIDITVEVEAREQLAQSDERNRTLAQHLQRADRPAQPSSKAPRRMWPRCSQGISADRSRCRRDISLPRTGRRPASTTRWIDDDHLIVYLLDVSGHGVAPALVSISGPQHAAPQRCLKTMLAPRQLLTELNRQFQMDAQGGNYFTIWYGVPAKSTTPVCYASAGHPPALMFTGVGAPPIDYPPTAFR